MAMIEQLANFDDQFRVVTILGGCDTAKDSHLRNRTERGRTQHGHITWGRRVVDFGFGPSTVWRLTRWSVGRQYCVECAVTHFDIARYGRQVAAFYLARARAHFAAQIEDFKQQDAK